MCGADLDGLSVPWTDAEERMTLEHIDDKFWRAEARRGFMERPDVHAIFGVQSEGADTDVDNVTYYVGNEAVVPRKNGRGMARWQEILFTAMGRNAERLFADPRGAGAGHMDPHDRGRGGDWRHASREASSAVGDGVISVSIRLPRRQVG